jgi:uncharacterized repeat protein (TIGR01451 family)
MKKIIFFYLLLNSFSASALDPAHFTIQRISAPYFVVDGNSPTSGPQTAYVGFKITNSSASTSYSNLKFTITSIITSVPGQNYVLVSPASGICLVGSLAAGETKTCYYYVSYPANITPQATFNYGLSDLTASSKTGNFIIYNRSSISANAGGLATQTINSQDLIGGVVYDDVTYTLGNIKNGDEADFQVSVSTQFFPEKLLLQKTEIISSTVPGIAAGTLNSLYFITAANQSSGAVTIRWTFKIATYNFTTLILPYAGATSGSTNYKYAISTDLGSGTPITISALANTLTISKSSDQPVYSPNATAIFTVTIQNPGLYPVSIDKITDEIPAGFTYQALHATSQVTSLNSTTIPISGASGTVNFEGGVTSGTAIAPGYATGSLLTTARGFIGASEFGSANNTVSVSLTLPVVIKSLKGSYLFGKVKLEWVTTMEDNSSHFEIQRKNGSGAYLPIGNIQASGNSSSERYYSFTDLLLPD